MDYTPVIDFWFTELSAKQHFTKSEEVDKRIRDFSAVHAAVVAGETAAWRETAVGALAEIIVLDQFSRNMFRGSGQSFAYDEIAQKLVAAAILKGQDQELPVEQRLFMYMPYMHSESKELHEEAVVLFTSLGNVGSLEYEYIHKNIIDQFGRYPHRNKMLGRASTAAEEAYLAENTESFF